MIYSQSVPLHIYIYIRGYTHINTQKHIYLQKITFLCEQEKRLKKEEL